MMKESLYNGAKIFFPLFFVVVVLVWLINQIEALFAGFLLPLAGKEHYFYGLGLLFALFLSFLIGLFIRLNVVKRLFDAAGNSLKKLPVVHTLHRMSSDTISFFSNKSLKKEGRVVAVETPIGQLIGILTSERPEAQLEQMKEEDRVAVYFPMSYQIGGFTFFVPKKLTKKLAIKPTDAMGSIMTAWLSQEEEEKG